MKNTHSSEKVQQDQTAASEKNQISSKKQNPVDSDKTYSQSTKKDQAKDDIVKDKNNIDESDSEQYKNYTVKDLVKHCKAMNGQILWMMKALKLDMKKENDPKIQQKQTPIIAFSSGEEKNPTKQINQDNPKQQTKDSENNASNKEFLQKEKERSLSESMRRKQLQQQTISKLWEIFDQEKDIQIISDSEEPNIKKLNKVENFQRESKVKQTHKRKKIRPPRQYQAESDNGSESNKQMSQNQKEKSKKALEEKYSEKLKQQEQLLKVQTEKKLKRQNEKFEKKMVRMQKELEKKVQKEQIIKRRQTMRRDLSSFKIIQNFDGSCQYSCGVCEKNFRSRSRVQQHLRRVCMRGTIMKCPFIGCRKVYTQEENYLKHMELHSLNNDQE